MRERRFSHTYHCSSTNLHGYITHRGTTYNAYIIVGAKRAAETELRATGIELVENDLDFNYRPTEGELKRAVYFGREIAKKIRAG